MPVLQLVGLDATAPGGLLPRLCGAVAEGLNVPPDRVWAYWVSVAPENLWRPGFSDVEQRAPICVMHCRRVYEGHRIRRLLDALRGLIAERVQCPERAVFVIVQRVEPGELLSFGTVWTNSQALSGVQLDPVGVVRTCPKEPVDDCWGGVESAIELAPRFGEDSVEGLDGFSHVDVIFLLHQVHDADIERGARHPRGRLDWPEVGIFAQRARGRPNRIGLSTCQLIRVAGTTIYVKELDAIDGTPVLDIKPHFREFGPRGRSRQPAWADELMAHYFDAGPPRGTARRA